MTGKGGGRDDKGGGTTGRENIWSKCCIEFPCICASGVTEAGKKGAATALPWRLYGITPSVVGFNGN